MERSHAYWALFIELGIVICFLTACTFSLPPEGQFQYWKTLQDIHIMIFIGFGFLMSYLKRYGWGAVAFTYWSGVLSIQLGILFVGLWERVFCDKTLETCHHKIPISLVMLIRGDVAGVAVLITVGAVMGKYNCFQYMAFIIVEVFFYALNERLLYKLLGVADVGASISVHLFGAIFGVVLAQTSNNIMANYSKHYGECYTNDIMAMIGTLFLFIYWPSFNGGLSSNATFHRVVLNTALALLSSIVTTFIFSSIFSMGQTDGKGNIKIMGKFKMEHIQNSSLAGGVMIGTVCDMLGNPGVSVAIGFFAGIISTFGFEKVKPFVSEKLYHDTCGITMLHLVPGFIGAILGVIVSAIVEQDNLENDLATVWPKRGAPFNRDSQTQAAYQAYGILVTIAIASTSGKLCGYLMRQPFFHQEKVLHKMFTDDLYWETGETSSMNEEDVQYTSEQLMVMNRQLEAQNKALVSERRKTIQFLLQGNPEIDLNQFKSDDEKQ